MTCILPYFDIAVVATSLQSGTLPPYLGSTIRGAVAYHVKKRVCAVDHWNCTCCHLRYRCWYPYLFEPPPLRKIPLLANEGNPPAVIFIPPSVEDMAFQRPRIVHQGKRLEFTLRCFGSPGPAIELLIHGIRRALWNGLGYQRLRFEMTACVVRHQGGTTRWVKGAIDGDVMPFVLKAPGPAEGSNKPRVRVTFVTPFRLKQGGRYGFDGAFRELVSTILRRFSRLCMLYGHYESYDYQGFLASAEGVTERDQSLQWADWVRLSRRQRTKMKLGGMMGWVEYRNVPGVLYEWLKVGEVIHLGKNTVFGLGRIRVDGVER